MRDWPAGVDGHWSYMAAKENASIPFYTPFTPKPENPLG